MLKIATFMGNHKTGSPMIGDKEYLCPKCKGHLNAGGYIIFSTRNKRHQQGLILLHPEVGSYEYKHHNNYGFEKGEMVDFFCPICQANLETKKNKDYAGITMIDHQNEEYEVMFSREAGKRSTVVVSNDEAEAFGDHHMDLEDLIEEEYFG